MGITMLAFAFMKGKHGVILRAILICLLIAIWATNLFAGSSFFYWCTPPFVAFFYLSTYGDSRFTPTAFSKYFPPDRDE